MFISSCTRASKHLNKQTHKPESPDSLASFYSHHVGPPAGFLSQQKSLNSCMFSSPVDSSYSQLIAEWPVAVLVLCSVTAVVCTLAGLLVGNLPDFSEPLMVSHYR